MQPDQTPQKARSGSQITTLLVCLNLLLVGCLLYAYLGRAWSPGGGISVVIANDTMSPMIDMSLSYPGGKISLPRLDPRKAVGNPLPRTGEFDATLSFKNETGGTIIETFHIKPVGELLLVIHVLPVLEEESVKSTDGSNQRLFKAASDHVRILTTFQGENNNI